MAVVVVGQCLVAIAVVLTGLVGARWHVGFPMWNRVSRLVWLGAWEADKLQMTWGLKASFFPVSRTMKSLEVSR